MKTMHREKRNEFRCGTLYHNIVYSCKYHIVFCPKYRRKVLVNGVDVRLKELIRSIADENKFEESSPD